MDPAAEYSVSFERCVKEAFSILGIESAPVIERPRSGEADLCLVCFPLSKGLEMSPEAVAGRIKSLLPEDDRWSLKVHSGYLNCIFNEGRYVREAADFIWRAGESYGELDRRGVKVIVEHTSANPNGPFHVGRARNPIIGDTLVRMMRAAGYDVEAQYWVNDMGKQVMLLVWGMANIPPSEISPPERDKEDHLLVRYYQTANSRLEENSEVEEEINGLLKRYEDAVSSGDWKLVISRTGAPVIKAEDVRNACLRVLDGMRQSLSRLNVSFDSFVFESEVVEDGSLDEVVGELKKSGLCGEEDGAYYLDLSGSLKGGDMDRFKKRFVFTRADGSALYTTRDLAYHRSKLVRCDRAINVLGEDHRYQSTMLRLALKEIGVNNEPEVVFYSFVSLPGGKMSTRRGRVVFLDDLLDIAVERAGDEVKKRREDLSDEEMADISVSVGLGALRFNMISVQPEKKIVFRWEDALSFEGATSPFVQYSHARASSIIEKSEGLPEGEIDWTKLVEDTERGLVKTLSRFREVIGRCADETRIHLMANYLVDTASTFNEFYRDCPVLSEEDPERKRARLALVEMTRRVIGRGLWTLGIDAPPRM